MLYICRRLCCATDANKCEYSSLLSQIWRTSQSSTVSNDTCWKGPSTTEEASRNSSPPKFCQLISFCCPFHHPVSMNHVLVSSSHTRRANLLLNAGIPYRKYHPIRLCNYRSIRPHSRLFSRFALLNQYFMRFYISCTTIYVRNWSWIVVRGVDGKSVRQHGHLNLQGVKFVLPTLKKLLSLFNVSGLRLDCWKVTSRAYMEDG